MTAKKWSTKHNCISTRNNSEEKSCRFFPPKRWSAFSVQVKTK